MATVGFVGVVNAAYIGSGAVALEAIAVGGFQWKDKLKTIEFKPSLRLFF